MYSALHGENTMSGKRYVYFVLNKNNGLIKIGRTENIKWRIKNLKFEYGNNLKLLFHIQERQGLDERLLRKALERLRSKQPGGGREWYTQDIMPIINLIKRSPNFRLK